VNHGTDRILHRPGLGRTRWSLVALTQWSTGPAVFTSIEVFYRPGVIALSSGKRTKKLRFATEEPYTIMWIPGKRGSGSSSDCVFDIGL
jgi:hypothetical protein